MSNENNILSKWWAKLIIGLIGFGGLGSGLLYIGSLVYDDLPIVKDVKEIKSWMNVTKPKVVYMMTYIVDEDKKKQGEYQVGLRFKKANKKLYYRDKNREYREIFHDTTGDYYRDENDKRVYITDKY